MKNFFLTLWQSLVEALTQKVYLTIVASIVFQVCWQFGYGKIVTDVAFVLFFLNSLYWIFAIFRYDSDALKGVQEIISNSIRFGLVLVGGSAAAAVIVGIRLNLLMSVFVVSLAYVLTLGAVFYEIRHNVVKSHL